MRPWGRPSAEEQAWLDQEMMAMESDSGSVWSPTPSSAHHDEEESEESYVSRILASHPQLEAAEARWLYAQQTHHSTVEEAWRQGEQERQEAFGDERWSIVDWRVGETSR